MLPDCNLADQVRWIRPFRRFLGSILVFPGVLLAGCQRAGHPPQARDSASSAVAAPTGARIFLAIGKRYSSREPLTVEAVLANAGDVAPLMYAVERYNRIDWHWRIIDEHGTPVRRRWDPTISSNETAELAPGAARVDAFDLREIYDLKPGRYTVYVQKRVWASDGTHPVDVRSAEFPFEVLP